METRRRDNDSQNFSRGNDFSRDNDQSRRLDLPHYASGGASTYGTDYGYGNYGYTEEDYGSEKGQSGVASKVLAVAGGLALAVAGGALAYRGVKNWGRKSGEKGVNAHAYITVNKSPEEVYQFWRQLSNLPQFMEHLKEVREMDTIHSHWVAKFPGNLVDIEWDAEVIDEEPGRFIAWRSVANADVDNSGEVRFESTPDNSGTIIHAIITYRPPAGVVGSSIASMLNPAFEKTVQEDLRSFRNLIEGHQATGMTAEPAARKTRETKKG
ncbi:hypothetical protein BH24BAC1_BH24BAC1_04080 [soil metagenome]|jgi:uncharacterized membrane protein